MCARYTRKISLDEENFIAIAAGIKVARTRRPLNGRALERGIGRAIVRPIDE